MIGVCITVYREDTTVLEAELHELGYVSFIVDAEVTGERRGIAPCLIEAWGRALDAGCLAIVQMDAGDSHNPQQARRLSGRA